MLSNGIKVDDIYFEIASGLNENRKELSRLIRDVDNNQIKNIFITYREVNYDLQQEIR